MSKPLVVLIHGLIRSKYSMSLLERKLRKLGYRTYNHHYSSTRHPIATHSAMLHQALSKVAGKGEDISFVTHSLGSIIMRKLVLDNRSDFNFKRAVMLGPPNQGSRFARRIRKIPLISTILGSSYLEICELNLPSGADAIEIGIIAGGKSNQTGYSPWIAGDNDGIVAVDETYLQGAKDHKVIPMLHSFLMYSREVTEQVIHFLENGSFTHNNNQIV